MGRNMFGGGPGPWSPETPWNGWWGDNPPYHHPVFVLTHHERPPLALEGGTTFHFVTQGPEAALDARAPGRRHAGRDGRRECYGRAAVPRERSRRRDGHQPGADPARRTASGSSRASGPTCTG